ncbi:hypothetical protein HD553DRAFT_333536, partial [Filobasidium floriforme]
MIPLPLIAVAFSYITPFLFFYFSPFASITFHIHGSIGYSSSRYSLASFLPLTDSPYSSRSSFSSSIRHVPASILEEFVDSIVKLPKYPLLPPSPVNYDPKLDLYMRGQYLKELGYNGASLHDAYETCRPDWLDDVRTPLASPQTVSPQPASPQPASPQPASIDDNWPPVSPLSRRMRKLEFRLHDLYWNIYWDFEDWFFQESGLWSCLSKVPIDAAWHLMELARGLAGFAQGLAKIFVGFAQGFAKVFVALFLGLSALEDLLEAIWVFLGLVRPNEDLVYYLWQRVLLWQWEWELDIVDEDLPTAMPGAYPGFEVERPTPKTKIDVNKETEIDRKTEIDAEIDTNKEAELSLVYPDGQTPPVPTLRRGQEGGNVCRLLPLLCRRFGEVKRAAMFVGRCDPRSFVVFQSALPSSPAYSSRVLTPPCHRHRPRLRHLVSVLVSGLHNRLRICPRSSSSSRSSQSSPTLFDFVFDRHHRDPLTMPSPSLSSPSPLRGHTRRRVRQSTSVDIHPYRPASLDPVVNTREFGTHTKALRSIDSRLYCSQPFDRLHICCGFLLVDVRNVRPLPAGIERPSTEFAFESVMNIWISI